MPRVVLLCLFLVLSASSFAQEELIGLQVHEENASVGYIFFAPLRARSAYLMDKEGRVVKEWRSEYEIFTAMLLDSGNVLMGVELQLPLGGWRSLEAYDWDGNLLWRFEYPDMHHAFHPMPNGNILIASWNRFTEDEILAMGLNPALMTAPDVTTNNEDYDGMLLDTIIELEPETMAVVWEWRVQDHLVQDFDEGLPNFGVVAAEPKRINLNMANLRLPSDRPHINSLDYNPELDQILISAHYFSEIWIIDHRISTEEARGEAGNLLYRWGNPLAYQRGTTETRKLFFQHDAQWLENGNILIFNNGMPIFRPYSSITEIEPPEGYPLGFDTAYEPAEPVWDDDLGFHSLNLGSVQRLENGHHLVGDGLGGRIFELDAEGRVVWDYLLPVFLTAQSRASFFVARQFSPDAELFAGRELEAGEAIPFRVIDEE
jgi:hypothetical protein